MSTTYSTVTFTVPYYNRLAHLLKQRIHSILNQDDERHGDSVSAGACCDASVRIDPLPVSLGVPRALGSFSAVGDVFGAALRSPSLVLKVFTFAAALVLLSAADVAARTISLAWDPSPDPVAGYRVYWSGEPGVYSDEAYFDVGNSLMWTGDLPGTQHYFAVRAYDADGNLGPFSLEVGDTSAFFLSNPGDQSSETGQAVVLPLVAHGAAVTFSAYGLPAGLGVDAVSGQIFGTVTASVVFPAIYVVTARAVDAVGHVSSVQFYWTIRKPPEPPTVENPGVQTNAAGDVVVLPIDAVDLEGGTLEYSASNLPAGLTIDARTGLIIGTIAPTAAGIFDVSVAVSNGRLVATVRFAWQILTADTGLTVDRVVSADARGSTAITPPFSTALAGETLIAFVETAQPASEGAVVSGGGLQWSLVTRANAQAGTAEIWSAHAPARLSNVTVSADVAGDTFLSLTVVSLAGADGVGASAAASAAAGAPAVSLTTTRAGSFVFGAGNDWDGAVSRTMAAGQEIVHEAFGELGDTFWVQRVTGAIAAAGTPVTVNAIEPTDHQFNIAAVEILARVKALPAVVLTPALALPGGSLTASISDAPGNPADFAGLFRVTADSTQVLDWQYLNGSTTPPETGMTSAQLSFAAPTQPGQYNVRLFAASDRATPIAVSNAILVPGSLSINDSSISEGSAGSSSMLFTVTLSSESVVPVSVNYATADGTAKKGSDYAHQSGTLVFAPGTTTQTIAVAIYGDTTVESSESFSVVLSGGVNAIIADAQGLGTISNDDAVAQVKNQMVGSGALIEGRVHNLFVFRVAEGKPAAYSRLEYWSSEPTTGKDKDKQTHIDNGGRRGRDDSDYGRDHRAAKNRFESRSVSSVAFGPRDKKGGVLTFAGAGVWNGKSGFTFEARAMDRGEPGRGRDTFSLIVRDKHGTVVLDISGTLDKGNIQASQGSRH